MLPGATCLDGLRMSFFLGIWAVSHVGSSRCSQYLVHLSLHASYLQSSGLYVTDGAPGVDSNSVVVILVYLIMHVGEDSIEHYCQCPQVLTFARSSLRVPSWDNPLQGFLLLSSLRPEMIVRQALLIYAVYSVQNHGRHHGRCSPTVCKHLMMERVRSACMLHKECAKIWAACWQNLAVRGLHSLPS